MEKCSRCNGKEAMFACMECESFRLLCERCDNYLHSLPGKKEHHRVALTPQGEEALRKSQSGSCLIENNKGNNTNEESLRQTDEPSPIQPNTDNIITKSKFNSSNEESKEVDRDTTNNLSGFASSTNKKNEFAYSTLYSKDYLNELKSSYTKDQIDFKCQGSSLRTQLEKLKLNFSDQITVLAKQIEDYELAQSTASQSLESKYKARLANAINDREAQITTLQSTIDELRKKNEELHEELNRINEENHQKVIEYERVIKTLQDTILKKDEEIYIVNSQLQSMVAHNETVLQNETHKLMTQYENKIHEILNEADQSRDQLLKVIQDRENDIKSLVTNSRGVNDDMVQTMRNIKQENEKLLKENERIKEDKEKMEKHYYQRETDYEQLYSHAEEKDKYASKLEDDIQKLSSQNRELNSKVKKLEAMIYGKIKPNQNKK